MEKFGSVGPGKQSFKLEWPYYLFAYNLAYNKQKTEV